MAYRHQGPGSQAEGNEARGRIDTAGKPGPSSYVDLSARDRWTDCAPTNEHVRKGFAGLRI